MAASVGFPHGCQVSEVARGKNLSPKFVAPCRVSRGFGGLIFRSSITRMASFLVEVSGFVGPDIASDVQNFAHRHRNALP